MVHNIFCSVFLSQVTIKQKTNKVDVNKTLSCRIHHRKLLSVGKKTIFICPWRVKVATNYFETNYPICVNFCKSVLFSSFSSKVFCYPGILSSLGMTIVD